MKNINVIYNDLHDLCFKKILIIKSSNFLQIFKSSNLQIIKFSSILQILILSLISISTASAQLVVNTGYTAQQLAEILAGPGITVSNATLTGAASAAGVFDGTNSNIGANSGVILCTGDINIAVGPNNQGGAGASNGLPGTPELDAIAGVTTNDAVVLQFDFEVQTEFITFNYVFASDEYLEFVDQFNDVFAFWISGPGINGWENIALIPNTTVPVTINNINDQDYWQYYVDNGDGTTPGQNPTIQYDGFTTLLAATKDGLIPCETYTLRLAIADALDWIYDSGVFLEENSLVQGTVDAQTNTINADNVALEGCIKASFTFTIDTIKTTPTVINYGIGGTAINGVDYVFIDSTMTIPIGQTSATIIIDAIGDGIPEPQEVVELYFIPAPCTPPDTVFLYIDDAEPINFSLSGINLACAGDSAGLINATITGGFPPYNITLNDQYTFDSLPITNLPADTYLVSITDIYGCDADAIVTGGIDSAGLTFLPDGDGNVYTTSINITAFNPAATLTDVNMLQSICITMEHSFLNEVEIRLIAPDSTEIILKQQPGGGSTNLGEPVPKQGAIDDSTAGIGYQYCFTQNPVFGTMVDESNNYTYTYTDTKGNVQSDKYIPPGSFQSYQPLSGLLGVPLNGIWTIWVKDHIPKDNGYIFNWTISLTTNVPDSIVILTEPDAISINDSLASITFATCGDTNGAIDVAINGNYPPYTYIWSTGDTTEDINNLSAGSYTLTVTDSNGCSNSNTYLVQNLSSMVLSATVDQATCFGSATGSIDLTVSSGIPPYIYIWNNGDTTEDISGLSAGDYTVTITDSVGCISLTTATVNEPDILSINTINISNEKCAKQNGSIEIAVTGGTAPFTFNWSNGETTQNIDTLTAGSHIVIITDSNSCTVSDTFYLINEVGNCVIYCSLQIDNVLVTDEICGNGTGAIDITTIDGTQPFIYSWSNGAATEDINTLNAATYIIIVTDADACEVFDTIIVNNITGTLAITNTVVTNEICGNGQGVIDNTISGGALPYSFTWSNGQTTEDATGLSFGNYSCTITDANTCLISMDADIVNDAGTLVQTWGNALDEICGNSQGSIDIIISGGIQPYFYLWTNGATTEDLINISAGTYTCTITDWNGCQITTPSYIINNDAGTLIINDIDVFNETCGDGAGAINITIAGGTTPYSFLWDNSATSEDINNLNAGTYSCQVSDANSCSVNTGTIEIFNSTGTLLLDNIFIADENCSNGQGVINITITGGGPPYSFAWSNGSTSEDLSGLSAGSYSCVITDTNGCTINTNATINNIPGTLTLDNTVIINEICGNSQGAADLFISGGTPPSIYLWSNGDTTGDISNLSAGNYTCQITDINGCSITASANVLNDAGTLILNNIVITNEICGNSAGIIDISISGGVTPYNFNWDNGAITEDLNGLSAGSYSCQVTDDNGCIINVGPVIINNFSAGLIIDGTVVTNESCGNAAGAVDLTISGGTLPYTFIWNNGDSTEDISGLIAGTYSCQITDANGCSVNTSVEILNDAGTLSLDNFAVTDEVCGNNAGAIDLTISGGAIPYTFIWSNGDNTEDISGLNAGNYFCIISDANNCDINTDTFNVANNPATLSLDNIFVNDESCNDSTGYINITVSGGTIPYTFSWSDGSASEDIFGLRAGTYSCQITDANSCTIDLTANVSNNAGNLTVSDSIITHEFCSNGLGTIDISVAGGFPPYAFNWSNGDTTEDISGISNGVYNLLVTDTGGCSANHSVTINNLGGDLTIIGTSVTNEICGNGTGAIDITVSGGGSPYSYNWSNGATTEDISGLSSGNYSVTVTDTNSCIVSAVMTVQNSSVNLNISNVAVTDDYCAAGTGVIDITVTGGTVPYFYNWSNGAITQDISGLFAGNYSVIVTDWNGCGTNMSANVLDNAAGYVINNVVVTDEICGDSTGAIDITVSGGTAPYTFAWSNGAVTEYISGLNAGNYSVTVTDTLGCSISTSATVQDNSGTLIISNVSITDDNCGDSTGAIDITISGGAAPYTFAWSNGAVTEDVTGLSEGNYTFTVTDTNNCNTGTNAVIVNIAAGYVINNAVITDELCSDSLGAVDLTVSGGSSPYTYAWNNGDTTEDITGLSAGNFTVTITDSNGCNIDTAVTVQNNPGTLSVDSVNVTDDYCGDGNGAIDIVVSGGTLPFYFNWSNGDTTEDITGLSAGNYSVTLTDTNNCITGTNADILNIAIGYEISNVVVSNDFCGDGNGYIDITVSAGTPPYTYLWSNGATTEDITALSAGLYTVTVSDSFGCIKDTSATILNIVSSYMVSDTMVTDEACGDGQGAIDITVSGGTLPYNFAWSNGATTEDITGLSAGSYTCNITDNNGCDITVVIDVLDQAGISLDTIIITDESCGNGQGAIDITVSGGTLPYIFAWSNGDTTEDISGLSAGSYTCIITGSNGCDFTTVVNVLNQTDNISLDTTIITDESCGNGQGAIDITVSGGTLPYVFVWSNGDTTEDISGLNAGSYFCIITGNNGCSFITDSLDVSNQTTNISLDTTIITDEICGNGQGAINITVSGGTFPYSFAWSNGDTTEDITGLNAGSYFCIITGNNGCSITTLSIIVLNQINNISLDTTIITDEICGNGQGAIDITVNGGALPYTFAWSNGDTTEDITGLIAGSYFCIITGNDGCSITTLPIDILNQTANISLDTTIITNEICGNGQGVIDITVSGGVLPYAFVWSNGDTTEDITGLNAGSYFCIITGNNGCSITTLPIDVSNQTTNISLDTTIITDEICGNGQGGINITVSAGTLPYTFAWSNGDTTEDITGLNAGSYFCIITGNDGCSITTIPIDVLNQITNINLDTTIITDEICGNSQGAIDITVSAGTLPYTFVWSNGDTTEDITGLNAGSYFCIITGNDGCSITTLSIDVLNQTTNISVDTTIITDEICGNGQGEIDITVNGGSLPYAFAWSNGDTTEDITGLIAGNYFCIITGNNGCSFFTDSIDVLNQTANISLDTTIITDEICGNGQGEIDITVTGGALPYTFAWSNGDTTEDITGLNAASFTSIITDNNGCSFTTLSIDVLNQAGNLNLDTIIITNENCGDGQGAIDITLSGGFFPYTFAWSTGDSLEDISGLNAGNYTCQITDSNGCIINLSADLTNAGGVLILDSSIITDEICSNGQGAVDITVSGGSAPYIFAWNNGDTTEDINGLSAGNYTCQITDSNGCIINISADVINAAGSLILDSSIVTDEICGDGQGNINITVSGGTTPYIFAWSNGDTTEDITGLNAGSYFCIITGNNGCIITTLSIDVLNQTTNISLDTTIITDEICGNGQGAIDITVSGGALPYTFAWSNGDTTEDITGLNAGSYFCLITGNDGCSITTITIDVLNQTTNISLDTTIIADESCGNGQGAIDITVNGGNLPYAFTWSNGDTTEDITGLNAGTYFCIITGNDGCSFTTLPIDVLNQTTNISLDTTITTDEICGNGQGAIDITVNGGALPYAFAWSNGDTTEDITGLNAGSYFCIITGNDGCSITTLSISVLNQSNNITLDTTIITDESCGNGQGAIYITVTGGALPYVFAWSNGDTTEDITGLNAGSYFCLITGNDGCSITTLSITVLNQTTNITLDTTNITAEICGNGLGAIDITVSGGALPYAFTWSNGDTTEDIAGLSAGSYFCIITGIDGCGITTLPIDVLNQSINISLDTTIITDENCGNGQGAIDITVSGGTLPYDFAWNNGDTTEDINGLNAGIYTCQITDSNGCFIDMLVTVTDAVGSLITDSSIVTDEICGNGQGAVDITVSGGTIPYTYAWSNGEITEDINGLSAGNYTCQITDSNGCIIDLSENVTNAVVSLIPDSSIVTDEICGNGQGAVNITVSGGTTPYIFAWNNGETTEDINGLSAGNYTCTITDINGCVIIISENVLNATGFLNQDSSIVTDENCGNAQGTIDISVSGGTSPYTFVWSNGASTEDITGLSAGNYTCLVTDANSCVINISENVLNQTGTFSLDTIIVTYEICGNGQGVINITVSGGVSPYTYAWSNGDTSEDINGLSSGNYSVIITDNGGCIINQAIDVLNATGTFSLDNIIVTDEYCGNGLGVIDVTMSGGVIPYSFAWSNGAFTEDINGLSAGNYTCIITDSTGCIINTAGEVLNQIFSYSVDSIIAIDEVCNNVQGAIDITISGGFMPYTFAWSNGATTEDISNLSAGNFTCIITDSLGCILNTSGAVLNETQGFNIDAVIVTDEICVNVQGVVDITVSGGILPYTFAWSSGETTEDINGLSAANFTVTITDSLGCIADTTVTVLNDPGNLIVSNVSVTNEICGNGSGAIDITISGGNSPYSFVWSNGAVTEDIAGLSADTFTFTVTDTNGCIADTIITVQNNSGTLTISNVGVSDEVCGNGGGAVDVTISGGSVPYTFVWSNGALTEDIFGLSAGNYSVTVTDTNGCITNTSATVLNSSGTLSMNITGTTDDNCNYGIGAIDITVTGGNAPYNFIWSNGDTTEDITDLTVGSYTVTISDTDGCIVIDSVTINDPSGGPPQSISILGTTNVDEFIIENYSVSYNVGSFYYWTVSGGSQISGGISNAISIYWGSSATGLISVVEKNSAGCFGDTVSLIVNIGSIGINLQSSISNIQLKVYPNPNDGSFTVELESNEDQNIELKIINILGIEVFSEKLIMVSGTYHKQIDLKEFAKGIYNVQVITNGGVINKQVILE